MRLKAGNASSLLPEGTYTGTLKKVEEKSNADGGYLLWTFSISHHGEAKTVSGVTGMSLDQGSKERFWVEALIGRPLKDQEEVDMERLYGRACRMELAVIEKDGREYNRIGRVTVRTGVVLGPKKEPDRMPTEDPEGDEHTF
jgi:hypothetical protein